MNPALRKANIRLAVILALVALGVFCAFIYMNVNG